jgi:hypothetical protein
VAPTDPEDFYQQGTKPLVSRWRKVVEKDRDYVEKTVFVNKISHSLYTISQLLPLMF